MTTWAAATWSIDVGGDLTDDDQGEIEIGPATGRPWIRGDTLTLRYPKDPAHMILVPVHRLISLTWEMPA